MTAMCLSREILKPLEAIVGLVSPYAETYEALASAKFGMMTATYLNREILKPLEVIAGLVSSYAETYEALASVSQYDDCNVFKQKF